MGDTLDGIRLAVSVVVARIDRPRVAGAGMRGVQDPVQHGVAQVDVAGSHVDPGAQHTRAVLKFTGLYAPEQVEILLDRALPERTVLARFRQCAAVDANLLLRL